jgi:predicted transglutaminase-like cysteine proteinase
MFPSILRWLRARSLAIAFIAFGSPLLLAAGPVHARMQFELGGEAREPFGSATFLPAGGGLLAKWLAVWRQWNNDEKQLLAACKEDRSQCTHQAALELLAIVDDAAGLRGRSQLGHINRAINLAIRPVSDMAAHGSIDVWSSPLETLANHSGDCEDYAILKLAALLEAGISPENLRLVIVRDTLRSEDHAIVVARLDGQWLAMDNRNLAIVADTQLTAYAPLFLLQSDGARRYLNTSVASVEQNSTPLSIVSPDAVIPLP